MCTLQYGDRVVALGIEQSSLANRIFFIMPFTKRLRHDKHFSLVRLGFFKKNPVLTKIDLPLNYHFRDSVITQIIDSKY